MLIIQKIVHVESSCITILRGRRHIVYEAVENAKKHEVVFADCGIFSTFWCTSSSVSSR